MEETEKISIEDGVRAAVALHKRGQLDDAEVFYERVLEQAPDQVDALHFFGVLRHQSGDSKEAAELIKRAIELSPEEAGMHMNLGNVLRELGEREPAAEAYREAIRLAPDLADAHSNLGALYRYEQDFEAALTSLEKALALDPEHAEAHCNIGNLYRDTGDLEKAAASYERSVELQGSRAILGQASANLAAVLRRGGKIEEGLKVVREWLARDPKNSAARHILAAFSQENVPERAEDDYVRELFDGFAGSFDVVLGNLHYRAPKLVGEMVARLIGDASLEVLDLGCGTGLSGDVVHEQAEHLTGVDLSRVMLAKARERGTYDELLEAEITEFLSRKHRAYDLIISVDALCYFGALEKVMKGVRENLRPGGRFVFTVEKTESSAGGVGYRLESHGRYAHQKFYLSQAIVEAGLKVEQIDEVVLRLETGNPVMGFVVAATATDE